MALTGSFKYVFIPADPAKPIEPREGDRSGGLQDDFLVKTAKEYFHSQRGSGAASLAALDSYVPQQRKQLADTIRQQILSVNPNAQEHVSAMSDDSLLEYFQATESTSRCEIIAVTVPCQRNDHKAVSMYTPSDSDQSTPTNARATRLLQACGHTSDGIQGDVFVGRCADNEAEDIWERVDFGVEDASPEAEWVKEARKPGGGGGGTAPASSLSGIMSQTFQQQTNSSTSLQKESEDGYTWSQTEEEVELKFSVASGTKPKYVKVSFSAKDLKVTVAGQKLVSGLTGGNVDVDECTYTLQDEDGGRELCVTLGKKDVGSTWDFAVQKTT